MEDLLKGVNLYLVGMMGCGKSTIGKILARQLGYQFFDTDAVIEQAAKRSIADIFAQEGEAAFRELETQVLSELSARTRLAIATGGGIVTQQKNWSYLRHGLVVWLDLTPELLFGRLRGDTSRPLLKTDDPFETLKGLMRDRQPFYAQADVQVAITAYHPPDRTAQIVIEHIRQVIRQPGD